MPRDFKMNGVSLLQLEQAGFVTLLGSGVSTARVQLSLIWVACINANLRYQLLQPVLLHPFSAGRQLHEETAIASMQIRMQALRDVRQQSTCTLLQLRPGAYASASTGGLQVALPPMDCLSVVHSLPRFYLQNASDVLPMAVSAGDSSQTPVSLAAGGLFRGAQGQSKW